MDNELMEKILSSASEAFDKKVKSEVYDSGYYSVSSYVTGKEEFIEELKNELSKLENSENEK